MKYWVSNEKFTCQVNTDDSNKIIETAPILKKFMNQPIENLFKWLMYRFNNCRIDWWK